MTALETVVIAGAGQAGVQLATSLREDGFDGRIVLVGNESLRPYQRPPLSKGLLSGDIDDEEVYLEGEAFFASSGIEFIAGDPVIRVERMQRRLMLASGGELGYDTLVFATGSRNRDLPCVTAPVNGLLGLRGLEDARALRHRLKQAHSLLVIGAGFIGLEVAAVAVDLGLEVQVVEAQAHPMQRVLSTGSADAILRHHQGRGVRFALHRTVLGVTESAGGGVRVELDDGAALTADVALVAIGVVPNIELARDAGLDVADGIVVDHALRTRDDNVYAIGDCASFSSGGSTPARHRLESVQNSVDQARFLSKRLMGLAQCYTQVPLFWSDQGGLRVQIAGVANRDDTCVMRGDSKSSSFSVFRFHGERLTAVEAVNKPSDVQSGRRLLALRINPTAAQAADPSFDLKQLFS